MEVYRIGFLVLMFIFGAGLGSFACCQAWRIKLKGKVKIRGSGEGKRSKTKKDSKETKEAKTEKATKKKDGLEEKETKGEGSSSSKKGVEVKAEKVEKVAKVTGETMELGRRSVCLSCGHELKWYENIPILSWIIQKGKCRACGAKIGNWEIIAEVLMGVLVTGVAARYIGFFRETVKCGMTTIECGEFSIDFWTMPWYVWLDIAMLIIMLAFMTEMMVVFVYDARWGRMPERELMVMIVLGVAYFLLRNVSYFYSMETIWDDFIKYDLPMIGSCLGGVVILSGIYFALYKLSDEQLVGSGDYLLCLSVALMVGNWFLALIILFLSNFLASIVMLPEMLRKKKHMSTKVAFGPFVILAFMAVFILQDWIVMVLYSKLYF